MKTLFTLVLTVVLTIYCSASFAKVDDNANPSSDESGDYIIHADTVEYENDTNTIIAKGKVEIFKDDYILKADKIIYYKSKEKTFAHGNVLLVTPDGDEIYSDFMEIDNKLKVLIAKELSARVDKTNSYTASKMTYTYPDKGIFEDGSYTPCPVCKGKDPQWQIKSSKIYYTRKDTVSYWNNVFELYGYPVFYLPYFSSAAPDADPRSGLLFPTKQEYKNIYGYAISIPYYYRYRDDMDFTYSPMITTKQGVLHKLENRYLHKDGGYKINGEYLRAKKTVLGEKKNKYYINAVGNYQISDIWSLDTKIDRVSDKSYLFNYWDRTENYLTSNLALRYLDKRDHGYLQAFNFQGLRREDSSDNMPRVIPVAQYHKEFFDDNSNKYSGDINALNLQRKTGLNVRRVATEFSWDKTYFFGNNEIGFLRRINLDGYNFSNKQKAVVTISSNSEKNVYRVMPSLKGEWKYPFISNNENRTILLTPRVDLILSPNSSANNKIGVNDESQDIELNDSNLFSLNRYSGYDLVEHGTRASYGLLGSWSSSDIDYNLMVGQSYIVKKNEEYPINSGLRNTNFSDYVGRLDFKPFKFMNTYYRFRVDSDDAKLRRGELGNILHFDMDNKIFTGLDINTTFVSYNLESSVRSDIKKSLHLGGMLYIYKLWYLHGEIVRNFSDLQNFDVSSKLGLGYNGECSTFKLYAVRNYVSDPVRNMSRSTGMTLEWEIKLKNISGL